MEENKFKCPLCNSALTESKYYEVVGVLEERKKFESELKKQLAIAKQTKDKLEQEKKNIQKKLLKEKEEIKKRFEIQFERQKYLLIKKAQDEAKKLAKKDIDKLNKEKLEIQKKLKLEVFKTQKEFLAKGKEQEKRRSERFAHSLKLKTDDWKRSLEQIKELKEQLKKGTTPQLEGINLEHELMKELKNKFPHDRIEHYGQAGDILHYIICEGKEIALIVYECKKTQKFNKKYIIQIKNDVIKRNANYGVLVTIASDKKQSQFWVEKDILIVHPYGAIYIAEVLRKSLIQLYSLKLSDKELNERAKKLLGYIKSNKFRNSVKDNILRSKELQELLKREVEYHKTMWEKRHGHYTTIAQQSQEIEKDSNKIIGEDLGGEAVTSVLQVEVKPKKKRKIAQFIE